MGSAGLLPIQAPSISSHTFKPEIDTIELRKNSIYGSYIVASRAITLDEDLIEESPLILCPVIGRTCFGFICLTCFKVCSATCSTCNWPVCGRNCERGKIHLEYECKILALNKVAFSNPRHDYTAVKILRCLLLRDKDPDKWSQLLQHDAQLYNRSQDVKTKEGRDHVLNFILDKCQLRNHSFDSQTIELIMGICATNEFCLTLNDYSRDVYLIFHTVSYLTHSCEPNLAAVWKFHPTSDSSYTQSYFSVKFYASRDISPGEILTHNYLPETYSVERRHTFLSGHYYFRCDCNRCRRELFDEILSSAFFGE